MKNSLIRTTKDLLIFSNRTLEDYFQAQNDYEISAEDINKNYSTITDLTLAYALRVLDPLNSSYSCFSSSVHEKTSYARLFACLLVLHINKCDLDHDHKLFIASLFLDSLHKLIDKSSAIFSPRASHQIYDWHLLSHCIDAMSFLKLRPRCDDLPIHPEQLVFMLEQQIEFEIEKKDTISIVSTSNKLFHYLHLHSYLESLLLSKEFQLSAYAVSSILRITKMIKFPFSVFSKLKRNRIVRYFYHLAILDPTIVQYLPCRQNKLWADFCPQKGFGAYTSSDPCDDIDYIFILLALNAKTHSATDLKLIFRHLMNHFRLDGSFITSINSAFSYQGKPSLSSRYLEGNIWATWFRYLSMSYIVRDLGVNAESIFLDSPGYHVAL